MVEGDALEALEAQAAMRDLAPVSLIEEQSRRALDEGGESQLLDESLRNLTDSDLPSSSFEIAVAPATSSSVEGDGAEAVPEVATTLSVNSHEELV